MKKNYKLSRLQRNFALLLTLIIINSLLVYIKVYVGDTFDLGELIMNILAIMSIAVGYYLGLGVAMTYMFFFIIAYTSWLLTYAQNDMWMDYLRLLVIPAMAFTASNINNLQKETLIIYRRLHQNAAMHRFDEETELYNSTALDYKLLKQQELTRKEPTYHYSLIMIRIEFIRYVRERLGAKDFAVFLNRVIKNIRLFLKIEEELFRATEDALVIFSPLSTTQDVVKLAQNIEEYLASEIIKVKNQRICIGTQTACMFHPELAELHAEKKSTKAIILQLTRKVEEDIKGEYIK